MRSTLVIFLVVSTISISLAAVAISNSSPPVTCAVKDKSCTKTEDCCNGCCENNICTECNHSPCSTHHCPQGKECYLHKVTCIQAPCDPIPGCRKKDSDYEEEYN